MHAYHATVCGALFLTLAAGATVNVTVTVSVPVDSDDCKGDYEPLLCSAKTDCQCSIGEAICSLCPDDGGSEYEYDVVCWCSGLPYGATPTGNGCNPDKEYGQSR